jgi:uncharacterized protein YmfQ (DUF2313 family)
VVLVAVADATNYAAGSVPLVVVGRIYGSSYFNFFSGTVVWMRVTAAARYGRAYAPVFNPPGTGDALWGATVLYMDLTTPKIGPSDELLRRLLPPQSYDRNGVAITAETTAYGNALDAANTSADSLLPEFDPRTTTLMLPDWERVYGLVAGTLTVAQRQAALAARRLAAGGSSIAFFIVLAASLGYTADISGVQVHTVNSDVEYPLYDAPWRFVWTVHAHANAGAVPAAALEALINQLKPAHTCAVFTYY